MFDKMVRQAEAMPESQAGQARGYAMSVWYGDGQTWDTVVDYDDDGTPARVQKVGTPDVYTR